MSGNIRKCEDGSYRWVYELNMLKNPTILFTVWKVLLIAFGAVWVFTLLVSAGDRDFLWKGFWEITRTFAILTGVILAVGGVAYLIVAAVYGGKYCVLFRMDEEGIQHTQLDRQVKKAEAMSLLTVLAGAMANRPGVVGAGLLSSARTSMNSEFSKVRKVKACPRRGVIYVNMLPEHNQIYTEKEDFEFVLSYITERTANAKIIK